MQAEIEKMKCAYQTAQKEFLTQDLLSNTGKAKIEMPYSTGPGGASHGY